ncbi:MAG: zinc ABC transporter substrate-binding protein [Verrucomicrobia bacterium]|nr:zinc ABC transporter substrate-binding protein [Verrucomicrobiota bacterium]
MIAGKAAWLRTALMVSLTLIFWAHSAEAFRVVTTTTMITDLVREIGGERIEVRGLMGPEVDPHDYRATRADMLALRQADAVFYNGHFLEGAMTHMLGNLARRGIKVFAIAEEVIPVQAGVEVDPHIWFDPRLWARAAEAVVRGLSELDPDGAEEYRARGLALAARYHALFDWASAQLSKIPAGQRVLITSHDAFGYFGKAFAMEVVGLQGISTATEAGLGDIRRMADMIRSRNIPAIFLETSVSPRLMERVRELTGAQLGGTLFSDAMGAPGEMRTVPTGAQASIHDHIQLDTGTYEGMFKFNVLTIVTALTRSTE